MVDTPNAGAAVAAASGSIDAAKSAVSAIPVALVGAANAVVASDEAKVNSWVSRNKLVCAVIVAGLVVIAAFSLFR